jgi:hypothetical protein
MNKKEFVAAYRRAITSHGSPFTMGEVMLVLLNEGLPTTGGCNDDFCRSLKPTGLLFAVRTKVDPKEAWKIYQAEHPEDVPVGLLTRIRRMFGC